MRNHVSRPDRYLDRHLCKKDTPNGMKTGKSYVNSQETDRAAQSESRWSWWNKTSPARWPATGSTFAAVLKDAGSFRSLLLLILREVHM
jgi:hypothetical protein